MEDTSNARILILDMDKNLNENENPDVTLYPVYKERGFDYILFCFEKYEILKLVKLNSPTLIDEKIKEFLKEHSLIFNMSFNDFELRSIKKEFFFKILYTKFDVDRRLFSKE